MTHTDAPEGQSSGTGRADQYTKGSLSRTDLHASPFDQFHAWYSAAQAAKVPLPESVCLSTATLPSGRVSSRFVYLKELDARGFVIYSNWATSRKAADVASNPWASLAFWWREMERQVRVEGLVERLTEEESQPYFDLRARGSRIGAWASEQSKVLPETTTTTTNGEGAQQHDEVVITGGREILEQRVKDVEARFEGQDKIPVPDFWGGVRIVPDVIEFWQGRESRLHDRYRYERKDGEEGWNVERLSP